MDTITKPSATGERRGSDRMLYSPDEAAWQLGVSRSRVYELMSRGHLRSVAIGRSRRIPRQSLEQFVASLESESAA